MWHSVILKRKIQISDSPAFKEPQFNKDQPVFTHLNSSHARLNLQGWVSGGCPINAVILEFRPKGKSLFVNFAKSNRKSLHVNQKWCC